MTYRHRVFGIEASALQWFTTFITGRTQIVCIDGKSSDSRQLICGVPQGSVLGARMYTQMLADVIRRHDVQHHSYADDTQVNIMYVVKTLKMHVSPQLLNYEPVYPTSVNGCEQTPSS